MGASPESILVMRPASVVPSKVPSFSSVGSACVFNVFITCWAAAGGGLTAGAGTREWEQSADAAVQPRTCDHAIRARRRSQLLRALDRSVDGRLLGTGGPQLEQLLQRGRELLLRRLRRTAAGVAWRMQHSDGAVRPAGARPTSAAHADRAWQHAGKVGAGERAAGGRRGQGTPFVVDRRSAAGSSGVGASSLWPLLPHQTCYGTRSASLDLQPARGLKPARQAASRRCLVREQTLKFLYTHTCGATQSRSRPTLRRPRQRDAARAAPGPAHRAGRCCCDLSSKRRPGHSQPHWVHRPGSLGRHRAPPPCPRWRRAGQTRSNQTAHGLRKLLHERCVCV